MRDVEGDAIWAISSCPSTRCWLTENAPNWKSSAGDVRVRNPQRKTPTVSAWKAVPASEADFQAGKEKTRLRKPNFASHTVSISVVQIHSISAIAKASSAVVFSSERCVQPDT